MSRCFVGLGANQGQPRETFERVSQLLNSRSGFSLSAASAAYLSRAMGHQAGGDFVNAVVELQSALSPTETLAELQSIETELGRLRSTKWGPRVIDLDLLYFSDQHLDRPQLILPHPHAWYRRFVLEPMCEIAADFLHPVHSLTQQQLLQRIDRVPFKLQILEKTPLPGEIDRLQTEFPDLEIEFSAVPDETASLIVGQSENLESAVPVLNLELIPAENPEEAFRVVLDACLGHCERLD